MKHIGLALAALLAAASPASALPDLDPLDEGGDGLFDRPVVWGVGLGGAGLAAAAGLLYYLAAGGLRHVDRSNVLRHPMRQSLMQTVQERPGIHLRELAARHGTAVTNTQWHLRKLELAGLLKTQKSGGRRLYYPAAGGVASRDQAVQNAVLRNPNAQRMSSFLEANAGASQKAIADALGMNPGTVRWHLRKLEAAGLVRSVQEGLQVRYFLMSPHGRPPRPVPLPRSTVPSVPSGVPSVGASPSPLAGAVASPLPATPTPPAAAAASALHRPSPPPPAAVAGNESDPVGGGGGGRWLPPGPGAGGL